MARQRKLEPVRRDFCAAPQLGGLFMRDQPTVKGPPCGNKPGLRIEIAQPDSGLHRPFGKGRQPIGINGGMRRIHQHDMKRLQKRRIEVARRGATQQRGYQRRECGIINAHRLQDIGGKLCAGNIASGSVADHLRLVPEGVKGAADLIHHIATGLVIAARHQLRLDKPLFPFQPGRIIRKLIDKIFQRLGPAG